MQYILHLNTTFCFDSVSRKFLFLCNRLTMIKTMIDKIRNAKSVLVKLLKMKDVGSAGLLSVKIDFIIENAVPRFSARNRMNPRQTSEKVRAT